MNSLQICMFITTLTLPSLALRIEQCWTDESILIDTPSLYSFIHGYIDAELNDTEVDGAIIIKNIIFKGDLRIENEDFLMEISTKFDSIVREVRVQRIISFENYGFTDYVKTVCNLGFINNADYRMGAGYSVEEAILLHTEYCFRKLLCYFDPEFHRIGDDIVVISESRNSPFHTTSQKTINSIFDLAVQTLVNSLVATNKSIIPIPSINGVTYDDIPFTKIQLDFEGGLIDVLPYIRRTEDISIAHEGDRFIVSTAVNLTGGTILFKKIILKYSNLFTSGEELLKIKLESRGIALRTKISIDYNVSPCQMSLHYFDMQISPENVKFDESLGFFFKSILNTFKSSVIDKLIEFAIDPLKMLVQKLDCESLRVKLFDAKKTTLL